MRFAWAGMPRVRTRGATSTVDRHSKGQRLVHDLDAQGHVGHVSEQLLVERGRSPGRAVFGRRLGSLHVQAIRPLARSCTSLARRHGNFVRRPARKQQDAGFPARCEVVWLPLGLWEASPVGKSAVRRTVACGCRIWQQVCACAQRGGTLVESAPDEAELCRGASLRCAPRAHLDESQARTAAAVQNTATGVQ